MNRLIPSYMALALLLFTLQACTNAEQESLQQEEAETARQDSLEMVRQAELEEMRQDSLEAAAIAEAEMNQPSPDPEPEPLVFTEDGSYTIQIQSWRSRETAMNRAELLRNVGFEDAYVTEVGDSLTGDVWFRVKAGNVPDFEMAEQVQGRLKSEFGIDSWIDMSGE